MSVTVLDTPESYTPCYNGQWFTASSTQVASANFTYTVVVTDLITSATATYEIEQRPDTKLVFDASNFAKNYIRHYIPINEYGWQLCEDAVRKIRVNIGETYGTTPAYASGTNNDYIVWNAYVPYLSMPTYDSTDFVYKNSTSNFKYLTSYRNPSTSTRYKPDYITYEDRSNFLYALTTEADDLEFIRINAYDIDGNLLQASDIVNPYQASTTYTDKYICIDIGKKGLDNIASGDASVYPVLPSNTAYYDIIDGYTAPPATARKTYQRLYIGCEPRFDVYSLHFLDKDGNFETIHCPKVSEINVNSEKTYYRQNAYTLTSNVWNYDPSTPNEVVLNSSATKRYKLNSDWVTEEQCEAWQYIINSARVYLDTGSDTPLIPVKVMNNSWRINKRWNDRTYNVTLDIEFTFKETYQNG